MTLLLSDDIVVRRVTVRLEVTTRHGQMCRQADTKILKKRSFELFYSQNIVNLYIREYQVRKSSDIRHVKLNSVFDRRNAILNVIFSAFLQNF